MIYPCLNISSGNDYCYHCNNLYVLSRAQQLLHDSQTPRWTKNWTISSDASLTMPLVPPIKTEVDSIMPLSSLNLPSGVSDLHQGIQDKNLHHSMNSVSCNSIGPHYSHTNKIHLQGRSSFNYEPSRQQMSTIPGRLSLTPRNIYNQQDREPRTITNADNHFSFAQNLRQGLSVNQAPPRLLNNMQQYSPISQLASNMLMQRQMQMPILQDTPDPVNVFQGLHPNRLNPLQPQRQQVTPPFNLSKHCILLSANSMLYTRKIEMLADGFRWFCLQPWCSP
jgi:hypothetical protein